MTLMTAGWVLAQGHSLMNTYQGDGVCAHVCTCVYTCVYMHACVYVCVPESVLEMC